MILNTLQPVAWHIVLISRSGFKTNLKLIFIFKGGVFKELVQFLWPSLSIYFYGLSIKTLVKSLSVGTMTILSPARDLRDFRHHVTLSKLFFVCVSPFIIVQ